MRLEMIRTVPRMAQSPGGGVSSMGLPQAENGAIKEQVAVKTAAKAETGATEEACQEHDGGPGCCITTRDIVHIPADATTGRSLELVLCIHIKAVPMLLRNQTNITHTL